MSRVARQAPVSPIAFFYLLVVLASSLFGMAAVGVILVSGLPPWAVLLGPVAAIGLAGLLLILQNTERGLYFIAFAICPLGILQVEVAGVTVGLPEVLILLFFAKEACLFFFRLERPAKELPLKALLVYAAAVVIAMHTGVKRGNGPVAVLQDCRQFVEFIALYLLVVHRVSDWRQIKRILACYVLGGVLLAAHGIVQRFTNVGIPLEQVLSDAVYHGGTRSGSFYGATPLGGLLVLTIGAEIALLLSVRSRLYLLLLGGCAALCLTTIVFTNTRASWIALAIGLAFVFFSIRKTVPVVAVVVLAGLLFGVTLGPLVVKRMAKLEFSRAERSLLERVDYYTTAWHIFREYPLRGLGWGCRYTVSDILVNKRYVPKREHKQIVPKFSSEQSTVHSAYLQLLVKTGLLGLAAFLLFLSQWVLLVWRERRAAQLDSREHRLFAAVAGAVVGYLCHSGLENFFQWPVMAQSFWLFLGLSTVMATLILEDQGAAPPERPLAAEPAAALGEA